MMRTRWCLLFAWALTAGGGRPVHADEQTKKRYVLTFETIATEDSPWSSTFRKFARRAERDSKGRVKINGVFGSPAGEADIARRCVAGSIQLCGLTVGALSTVVKDLRVLELPFLFLDAAEADRILDGPALPHVKKILASHNLVFYAWSENGWRSFATRDKPIMVPGDLKGLRMRAQPNPLHLELYRALKAKPVSLKAPEVLEALKNGQIDGLDQPLVYLTASSWYKHIKYYTLTRHIYQPAIVAYNKKYLEKLPGDLQKLLLRATTEIAVYNRKEIRKTYEPLLEILKQQGVQVLRLTPVKRIPFVMATKPVHVKVYRRASGRAKKLLDAIYKAKRNPPK